MKCVIVTSSDFALVFRTSSWILQFWQFLCCVAILRISVRTTQVAVSHMYLCSDTYIYRVFQKKWHKVYCTVILQAYIIGSCSFQQNVQKEIAYMPMASVWIWLAIKYSLFCSFVPFFFWNTLYYPCCVAMSARIVPVAVSHRWSRHLPRTTLL